MTLPKDFEEYTRDLLGPSRYDHLVAALGTEPPVSLRLNTTKQKEVTSLNNRVPWCATGFYLASRPTFTFDPLLHAGVYYVQEASSMFVCEVLRQLVQEPVAMLDLCSAPGGKSTAALSALPEGSLVVSNEPITTRASVLTENIQKWGAPNTMVTRNYPQDYAKSGLLFDVILTDVPCSGEGMFRKDPNAVKEWSAQHVKECTALQREIVEQAWKCLRPGGLLIYSTCTINLHEDEENVGWICKHLGAEPCPIKIPKEWGIAEELTTRLPATTDITTSTLTTTETSNQDRPLPPVVPDGRYIFRFIPGETQGEGLFMAILRKPGEQSNVLRQITAGLQKGDKKGRFQRHCKVPDNKAIKTNPNALLTKLYNPDAYAVRTDADVYRAIPSAWLPLYDIAANRLHVLHAGVPLGIAKGHDIQPSPALALSTALKPDAFPRVELDYQEALSYLRREAVRLPDTAPKGYVVVCYQGHPLGMEKNMGNRANNIHPMEWRIKSTHLPEQPVKIIKG